MEGNDGIAVVGGEGDGWDGSDGIGADDEEYCQETKGREVRKLDDRVTDEDVVSDKDFGAAKVFCSDEVEAGVKANGCCNVRVIFAVL